MNRIQRRDKKCHGVVICCGFSRWNHNGKCTSYFKRNTFLVPHGGAHYIISPTCCFVMTFIRKAATIFLFIRLLWIANCFCHFVDIDKYCMMLVVGLRPVIQLYLWRRSPTPKVKGKSFYLGADEINWRTKARVCAARLMKNTCKWRENSLKEIIYTF